MERKHDCTGHGTDHRHGERCGHERVRHGDHWDYVVGDHLHHVRPAIADGCADHGPAPSARR